MKAKKLIEVALPIKEISAESIRDKSIRHGHISTLHLWWARRPLPVCRAVVFASLVPDPLDENCPEAFKWAVQALLADGNSAIEYKPYKDIPYTAIVDEMEDNLRHRLMMFIGKFSDKCQANMIAGKSTSPKEQLSDGSLIKWENKNNPKILRMARELIFVAYQSDRRPDATWEQLHEEFNRLYDAIPTAEKRLYDLPNRHIETEEVKQREAELKEAIEAFQNEMPSVFDPFAGGGAIPLEAARLGCRSYGNDINPVAHIIERGSADFPQKYGKPIVYCLEDFKRIYGEEGIKITQKKGNGIIVENGYVHIPNRLAFDVEYYSIILIKQTKNKTNHLYYIKDGKRPSVYHWIKYVKCANSSCNKYVPLFKQLYFSKPRNNKKSERIKHFHINLQNENVEIVSGDTNEKATVNRGVVSCPYCGGITDITKVKEQFANESIKEKIIALVYDSANGKEFVEPQLECNELFNNIPEQPIPNEKLQPNSAGGDILSWGYSKWGELFNKRQLKVLYTFSESLKELSFSNTNQEYSDVLKTYLAILIDKIAVRMSSFGKWHILQDTVENLFGRQAIQMNFEYPELDPFSTISSSAYGQLDSIISYIKEESNIPFVSTVKNAASGDKLLFNKKSLTAVITDPPYYDAIAYADISDFFYVWLKRNLSDFYPLIFSTPQTPKHEECTALKHHHNNSDQEAKKHFETKLKQIFDVIEMQTTDIVSIMFAHQSTQAWTTLCNSILDSRMNITGSWPMDTEVSGALKADKAFLESSVTVSCRPSERRGYADFNDVKHEIKQIVKAEVDKLYELGFRGADLLTACFGQAVSVFGHYKMVETAEGDPVTVGQLLNFARESAAQALLEGVPGEPQTKFYCGWLQMNGMGDTSFDDVNKYTRVGVNVEIRQLQQDRLLIANGNKQHLASAVEHIGDSTTLGKSPEDYLISQVHRLMLAYRYDDQAWLMKLVRELCPQNDAPHWRVMAFLKEHLPDSKDLDDVQGLLINAEMLRQKCKETYIPKQTTIEFED